MKHTKGQWTQGDISYRIETNHKSNGEHTLICEVASKNDNDYKLIAAAPELLEALQIAIRLIATAENNGAYKDCALPLIGKKSLEKMEALLERLK